MEISPLVLYLHYDKLNHFVHLCTTQCYFIFATICMTLRRCPSSDRKQICTIMSPLSSFLTDSSFILCSLLRNYCVYYFNNPHQSVILHTLAILTSQHNFKRNCSFLLSNVEGTNVSTTSFIVSYFVSSAKRLHRHRLHQMKISTGVMGMGLLCDFHTLLRFVAYSCCYSKCVVLRPACALSLSDYAHFSGGANST